MVKVEGYKLSPVQTGCESDFQALRKVWKVLGSMVVVGGGASVCSATDGCLVFVLGSWCMIEARYRWRCFCRYSCWSFGLSNSSVGSK